MGIVFLARLTLRLTHSRSLFVVLIVALAAQPGSAQTPAPVPTDVIEKLKVLDMFRGTWNVTLTTIQPTTREITPVVTFVSTNTWALNNRFLHGDSGPKSDGTRNTSMMTYDPTTGGYPLWIFFSNGVVFFLPSGQWDKATRTMVWKSPPNLMGTYEYRCVVPDARTHRCTSLAKNWLGKVMLEQDVVVVRREP
jgi:hypothetical protein